MNSALTSTDGSDIVRLQVVDDVLDSVNALLNSEVELVVLSSQELRHLQEEEEQDQKDGLLTRRGHRVHIAQAHTRRSE